MRRFFLANILIFLSAASYAASVKNTIHGTWTVTSIADSQDTTSMSSDDADKLVGHLLKIAADRVQFDDDVCRRPSFKTSRQQTRQLFRRDYRFEPQTIGLPDPVTEIKISCENPVSYFVYLKGKDSLVFYWKGFFLNAVRRRKDG